MNKKKIRSIAGGIAVGIVIVTHVMKKKAEKNTYKIADSIAGEVMKALPERKMGIYEKYVKRCLDIICATGAIVCFFPIYVGVALMVRVKLGSPVLFIQERPGMTDGGKETIFKLYKFRTMTDERNPETGKLLSDDMRLTKFGKWLRRTSLDELPETFNILNGTMSVIGPRPQLVRDMVFMDDRQRMRHTAKPGLSGLAQINGRNSIDWEDKFEWDLKYIRKVGFLEDVRIILDTVGKAFIEKEGITGSNMATAEDFGDYLLEKGKISKEQYQEKQRVAVKILENR